MCAMLVLFAIAATVIFQVGFCLFCFRLKRIQSSGQPLHYATMNWSLISTNTVSTFSSA